MIQYQKEFKYYIFMKYSINYHDAVLYTLLTKKLK
jgi:hypothetical protein